MNEPKTQTWQMIGRAGYTGRSRDRRKREFDARFGPDGWRICHAVEGELLALPDAARHCEHSYVEFLKLQPALLDWLCANARAVYAGSTSNVRSGLDYNLQERKIEHVADIALRNAVARLGREFQGERLVCIGGRKPETPALSPGRVPFYRPEWIVQPALVGWWQPDSVECFWQSNKVLVVRG